MVKPEINLNSKLKVKHFNKIKSKTDTTFLITTYYIYADFKSKTKCLKAYNPGSHISLLFENFRNPQIGSIPPVKMELLT